MYKNLSLKQIAEKFTIDLTEIEGKFVLPIGEILEQINLQVQFVTLQDGHSGYLDVTNKTIFVNEAYPATRNLFTIAHELGHYILHRSSQNRFDDKHKYTSEELQREHEANEFAGELLMPQYKFLEMFEKFCGNTLKISDIFGVSQKAVEVRAFNLGLIDYL